MILSIVLFLFPFQQLTVSAQTSTNIGDYKEFDSFMKRYYEHTLDLTQYVATSYQSNEYYSEEQYELFREAINTVYDTNKNDFVSNYFDSFGNLITKPMAIIGTANDLRKKLWDKVKGFFSNDEVTNDYPVLSSVEGENGIGKTKTFYPPEGYNYKDTGTGEIYKALLIRHHGYSDFSVLGRQAADKLLIRNSDFDTSNPLFKFISNGGEITLYHLLQYYVLAGGSPIVLVSIEDLEQTKPILIEKIPEPVENIINNIINHNYDDERLEDYEPTVEPILVCPTDKIPLTFVDGEFKTSENVVITLLEDETTTHNNENCQLDFEFPEIYYHPDGKLVVDGLDLSPIKGNSPVDDFDGGIVEYIRNSYNYATSVVSTGVNGLKSIVTGTSGLVTLMGSTFAFLPPELLTFMIGGFAIALGLWVFKK